MILFTALIVNTCMAAFPGPPLKARECIRLTLQCVQISSYKDVEVKMVDFCLSLNMRN